MYLTKYKLVVFLGILAHFRACPAKVAKDVEWIEKPQSSSESPEKKLEPEVETFQEDLNNEERNIPRDIDALTKLLEAVVGSSNHEYFDPKFDTAVLPNKSEVATLGQKGASLVDGRPKRQIGPLIASLIPQLSKFGGSILRSILSQLIYRGGDASYKQDLLAKFVPRVLSQTALQNSQTEQIINQQLKSRNYESVLQTINSAAKGLDQKNYVPEDFKHAFNQQENSPKMVLSVRKVFHGLVQTLDTLLTQRLSTSSNLMSSLLTSLIESLRVELEGFEKTHANEVKRLGSTLSSIQADLKRCGAQNLTTVYALLAAILVGLTLIFPSLFMVKNTLTAFMRKLQSSAQASLIRKAQRETLIRTAQGYLSDRDTVPILEHSEMEGDGNVHWPEADTLEMPRMRSRPMFNRRRGSFRVDSSIPAWQERQDKYQDIIHADLKVALPPAPKDSHIMAPSRTTSSVMEPRTRKNLASGFLKEDNL